MASAGWHERSFHVVLPHWLFHFVERGRAKQFSLSTRGLGGLRRRDVGRRRTQIRCVHFLVNRHRKSARARTRAYTHAHSTGHVGTHALRRPAFRHAGVDVGTAVPRRHALGHDCTCMPLFTFNTQRAHVHKFTHAWGGKGRSHTWPCTDDFLTEHKVVLKKKDNFICFSKKCREGSFRRRVSCKSQGEERLTSFSTASEPMRLSHVFQLHVSTANRKRFSKRPS